MTDRNPFLRRQAGRATGHAGRLSEKRQARRMGARQTPASGALEGAKGDAKIEGPRPMLVECKSTVAESMSVKLDWLRKIAKESLEAQRTPMLTVTFTHPDGKPVPGGEWALLPMYLVKELLDL